MANLVSNTGNLILTSLCYAPLIPIVIPIALIGLIFAYWVEKFNLTRRHRVPEMINGTLAIVVAYLLPLLILIWALSFYYTFQVLIPEEEGKMRPIQLIIPLISVGFVLLFHIIPVNAIIACFNRYKE